MSTRKKNTESKTSLTKPMKPMATELPASEVCAIIEACGKAGVRVLKFGGLYLQLGPAPVKLSGIYPLLDPKAPLPQTGPDHARQNAETLQRDEEEIRAEQLRMLMIENPLEYERQLRDGELSDDESRESD